MFNRITLIGHAATDPTLIETGPGRAWFTITVSERWKNKLTGEVHTQRERFHVTAWDKLAYVVNEQVHKGDLVFVDGKLHSPEEGKYEIKASNILRLPKGVAP
jgi:single-strand DNA-binding protein